jgi:hypothetical protein
MGKYLYVCHNSINSNYLFFFFEISSGSALGYKVDNLKANTQYEYRIQCKSGSNNERSEWSQSLLAATKPEPMSGETVFKAIGIPGKDQLEKLLNILYVIQSIKNISYIFLFLLQGVLDINS